jgi:hypothetical protein
LQRAIKTRICALAAGPDNPRHKWKRPRQTSMHFWVTLTIAVLPEVQYVSISFLVMSS